MTYLSSLRNRLTKEAGWLGAYKDFAKAHPMLNMFGSMMIMPRVGEQVNQTLQGFGVGPKPGEAQEPQPASQYKGRY